MEKKGLVFNIQHYSLHDGPGIRTIIFLKGCPLRCRWCSNPESQNICQEISYVENKCIGCNACGTCQNVCTAHAISFLENKKASIDRSKCNNCLLCVPECPSGAIKTEGQEMSVQEISKVVGTNSVFYRKQTGGMTVSGGEPLLQGDFLVHLLKEVKKNRISTAMESCGYGEYEVLKKASRYLDVILFDIKSMNEKKHQEYTGKSNRKILENFEHLCCDFPQLPKIVRTPVIPGFNNTAEDLQAIEDFLQNRPNVTYEKLPYHRLGVGKYRALGRRYQMES